MTRCKLFPVIIILSSLIAGTQNPGSELGFVGRWKLDVNRSTFPKDMGLAKPMSGLLVISRCDQSAFTYELITVNQRHKPETQKFDGVPDGRFYRVDSEHNTVDVGYQIRGESLVGNYKSSNAIIGSETITLSADRQTMTSIAEFPTPQGISKVVEVYEREK